MAKTKRVPLPSSRRLVEKQKPLNHTDLELTTEDVPHPQRSKRKPRKTKAITSCERCRHAHIKCVGNGAGEPCENCAKRGVQTCSHVYFNRDPGVDTSHNPNIATNRDLDVSSSFDLSARSVDPVVKSSYDLCIDSGHDRVADLVVVETETHTYPPEDQQLQIIAAAALAYLEEKST
ncbi:hypothetical protein GGR53DRAFT_509197 [Hypoxylon sp. FL1150]|nr:hypothetical protein GGR53DRAFT_509197 [Hypoxylon sp. FL1150]